MTHAARTTEALTDIGETVERILERLDRDVVCATPLALGKPVPLLNALYARAKSDSGIRLDIVTALSLAVPRVSSELERRFLGPFARRVFDGVPSIDYLDDLARGAVPANVRISEFYFRPGAMLGNPLAQQNYISANYTHVARDVVKAGCNLVLVMVSERAGRYSLSCNPDLTLDVVRMLRERERDCLVVAMVNRRLPFMVNDAEVGPEFFDIVVDAPAGEQRLFSMPNSPAVPADHAIGLYAASLVKDGGTLQLGIGSLGDAVAHWLHARESAPGDVRAFAQALNLARYQALIDAEGGLDGFEQGLFGASEMFTWGLMCLFDARVLKRRVYENESLQDALNRGAIADELPADALERLHAAGSIGDPLLDGDVTMLEHFGLLSERVPAGTRIADIPAAKRGHRLKHGRVLHGAFFLGPEAFYERLHELDDEERALFNMTAVSNVNDLFGEESLERLQRKDARFINICMKATLFGAAVSDALEDQRIVSGVGGQYNFVAMAHELEDARSILCLRATREGSGGVESNIVFNYGHVTIPRHLRDIYITEYGIADLRGRTDAECAMAMIEIADSRFQPKLVEQAKRAGKLPADYTVPDRARGNLPESLARRLQPVRHILPPFPLGTDFDTNEQQLVGALGLLKKLSGSWRGRLVIARALVSATAQPEDQAALIRMGLANVRGVREWLLRRLVISGLGLSRTGRVD